ncbi:MAG: DegQ family serine endoprotease [Burkholderiales bacterium]|uniref:DegQ family serine endoprotease n=1 Tax=Nitrosomonas sp. TaxID=42353 RepID=UPI001D5A8E6E|nr:DegQ family serine endoprotease [Nitrosomonas sp.]MCB1948613.1 DegQ family serine endoprotease [Nitrosomonas sp.]MCP5242210.1 DegQ family serine endoprotease [Burkholderiales bacterium]
MARYFIGLWLIATASIVSAQTSELPNFTGLVEKYGATVVNISTIQTQQNAVTQLLPEIPNLPKDSPFYEFFRRHMEPFSAPRRSEPRSMGSGFIISSDGYILTNAHVVESADEITVKLNDKREYIAEVIGTDKKTDIALIKIEAENLQKVNQGDPEKLKVGEWVVAIGSPFGFENSVTAGIVSAKGRSLAQENYVPFIQTDVAINPGNSGGPLFNMHGEVVGINSQIYSRTGGFMGLSFAIPINVATDIADQLKTSGVVRRGRIGVLIQEVTKELADSFSLSDTRGALVVSVEKNGPADVSGIRARDIILAFNGEEVDASADLPRIVGNTAPDSKVNVKIWRDGSIKTIQLTVGEIPREESDQRNESKQSQKTDKSNRLGLVLNELTDQQKKQLEVENGLLVENIQPGIASQSGIRVGDVILGFNSKDVESVKQFNKLLDKVEEGRNIALLIKRGDLTTFITMKLDSDE